MYFRKLSLRKLILFLTKMYYGVNAALIIIIVGVLVYMFSQCGLMCGPRNNEKYDRHMSSYYDEGSWIDHPPQLPSQKEREIIHGRLNLPLPRTRKYPSTNEPPPSGLGKIGTTDLCQECIGHCQIKMWAGVTKPPRGISPKDKCVQDCNLECNVLDQV